MFKPIKDFITFIQKNSSNANVCEEETENLIAMDETKNSVVFEEMDNSIVKIEDGCVVAASIEKKLNIDEDDIESQIKNSIMIKHSTQLTLPSNTSIIVESTSALKSEKPDHNQNLQPKLQHILPEEDDELADFKYAPTHTSTEDYCSVGSEIEDLPLQSADEGGNEIATEDEDLLGETSYTELEDSKKIFVAIDDTDLNSSIAFSNPDDPLAIDVHTLATDESVINPLDSSTNDEKIEVSSNGEILWYNTSDEKSPKPLLEQKQQSDKNAVSLQIKAQRALEIINDEPPNEEIERNDNSDSGLGTETSSLLLHTTIENSITESVVVGFAAEDVCKDNQEIIEKPANLNEIEGRKSINSSKITPKIIATSNITTAETVARPLRSNLKRRLSETTPTTLETENDSIAAGTSSRTKTGQDSYLPKKQKRYITFDAVQLYYFPRQQGFGCVPSAGGCTLGMASQHIDVRRLTLAEHAAELRRAHRLQLQEINPRGSSSEDTDESEEDYLSEGSGSDLDADSNGFLQPVPPKQRRAILKAAGVRKIDASEKFECRNIRNSREVCGCTCRDFCDPETCTCSRAGIKCQVDRSMFPCGCSRDACGNTTGRVEFNPARVRTHFIHTIMRLDMENRQQQQPASAALANCVVNYDVATALVSTNAAANNGGAAGYYTTQSNYSSGYASPAYDPSTNCYQQQLSTVLYPTNSAAETVSLNGTQYHSLDSIDNGIYTTNTTLSYGEMLPNYCAKTQQLTPTPTSICTAKPTTYHAQAMTYGQSSSYLSAYQQHKVVHPEQSHTSRLHNTTTTTDYLTQSSISINDNNLNVINSYTSCASSRSPYGNAITCNSTAQNNIVAPTTTSDTSYINLSTSIGSSSVRLSHINDLLQINRNTTAAALVTNSQHSEISVPNLENNSIVTPPINENQKSCFLFDAEFPLVTVSDKQSLATLPSLPPLPLQSKPPPTAMLPAIDYKNDMYGVNGGCNYPNYPI